MIMMCRMLILGSETTDNKSALVITNSIAHEGRNLGEEDG